MYRTIRISVPTNTSLMRLRRSSALVLFFAVLLGLGVAIPIVLLNGAREGVRTSGHVAGRPARSAVRAPRSGAGHPLVYVAIGASDSYGVGADDPATQSWPADLAAFLPPGTHFVNLGVPGILLARAAQVELPVTLDARPDLVTVWLAVDDLDAGVPLDTYRQELDSLLDALKHGTGARVLIANVPDLGLIPRFNGQPGITATVTAWNVAIAAAARAHGATVVDLFGQWRELAAHPEYVGADGFHPSTEGYRQIARLFWQAYQSEPG